MISEQEGTCISYYTCISTYGHTDMTVIHGRQQNSTLKIDH